MLEINSLYYHNYRKRREQPILSGIPKQHQQQQHKREPAATAAEHIQATPSDSLQPVKQS